MRMRRLALGGMIAAAYAALTVLLAPISYGPIQLRISEALTLLPFYFPEAVPGLFIGCLVANFLGGYGILDVIVGSSATLLAACLTRRAPNLPLAALPPIVANMLLVGTMLHFLTGAPFLFTVLYVGCGEAGACCFLGVPLMLIMEKRGLLKRSQDFWGRRNGA
ncbi:MAG: QueT transporter family protein [Fretibacterium sp.]|nr:QueT transporter family protein [Fretibacterium sp.]